MTQVPVSFTVTTLLEYWWPALPSPQSWRRTVAQTLLSIPRQASGRDSFQEQETTRILPSEEGQEWEGVCIDSTSLWPSYARACV